MLDPANAQGVELEHELEPDGSLRGCATVFLTGAECPFTCVFCDLWRNTLEGPTPAGALPRQLEQALATLPEEWRQGRLKLYNASNFFDPRAVPEQDLDRIGALVAPFDRVVVECHARLVGERCLAFAARLGGRLELALGLEVADDRVLARLGKEMTLADFERAAARLGGEDIPFRAFVLVGAPWVPGPHTSGASSRDDSPLRSVEYAFEHGAERVALIPVRGGNGAMEALAARGLWRPPRLVDLEDALDRALEASARPVTADLWDLSQLRDCPACFEARRARLARLNATGRAEPRTRCAVCEA